MGEDETILLRHIDWKYEVRIIAAAEKVRGNRLTVQEARWLADRLQKVADELAAHEARV